MKQQRFIAAAAFLLMNHIFAFGTKDVMAAGSSPAITACFNMTGMEQYCDGGYSSNPGPIFLKINAIPTGGEFYALQGIIPLNNGSIILDGTGVVTGNVMEATMNASQEHTDNPWRDARIWHIRLDLTTWTGTIWNNGVDFKTTTKEFDRCHSTGTITKVNCQ